ncbi:MAG: oxygen-independent coproporphyrinogen III oxidase, partial [Billgrantia desiderata]
LIGLGMSSISCIDDVYAQNHTGLDAYERALDASHLPTARGIRLSFDDRVRRHAIERLMCDMELDFDELSEAFGIDAPSYLADALTRLEMPQRDGLLRKEGSRVIATPLGRLLIRHLAMAFDTHLPAQPDTLFSRIV